MTRVWVGAAEASGDRLAASLIGELQRRRPGLRVAGMAGPALRAAGVTAHARAEDATALGLAEVATSLPRFARLLRDLSASIRTFDPAVVVTVDSPDLLLRVAGRATAPSVHWVSPQLWAWRPGRVQWIARQVDSMMCLLPFEPALYQGTRVRAVFTGHPAAGVQPAADPPRPGTPTFALLPGSRPGEVRRLWPALRQVAQELRDRHPGCGFVVPVAATIDPAQLGGLDVTYVPTVAECAGADAAVVASGTATVELAALGVPMVVIYRVHPLTWQLGKRLVRGVSHVALPNIIAGRSVVPEVLQELDPVRIADALQTAAPVPPDVLSALAPLGAVCRAADEVEAWL